jgi:hypothetical protein
MTEKGEKVGMAAALAKTGPGAPPAKAEQLDFLGDLLEPSVRSNASRAAAVEIGKRGGPGRPKGSGNRRTQEWCEFLDTRYTSPVEGLSAVASMSPRELLQALELWDVDPAEPDAKPPSELVRWAFERIQWSQKEAAPYRHAKLGNVVQDEDGNDATVVAVGVMMRPGGGQPGDGAKRVGGSVIDARPADVVREEKQRLSEAQSEPSNASPSNAGANALKDKAD